MIITWTLTGQMSHGGAARRIRLNTTPFRVGRRADLSLCLSRNCVSALHAELFVVDGALFVRDLQSTNGTFVNGERVVDQVEVFPDDLVQFADMPFRVGRQLSEFDSRTIHEDVCDRALGLVQFDKLISERAVISYFQPVVQMNDGQPIAYEVLSRSRLLGLEGPDAMFRAAGQLGMEVALSQAMRIEGVRSSSMFPEPPHIFVNTHPAELAGQGLLEAMSDLRRIAGSQRITVEIHESTYTDISTLKELRGELTALDVRLAFDDFGAGQARLCELAEVRPDYLKFDRQMIHEIHSTSPQRQQVLAHLVNLVIELGIVPLAEGIECAEEGEVCRQLGFTLAQGFFYGRPEPAPVYALAAATGATR